MPVNLLRKLGLLGHDDDEAEEDPDSLTGTPVENRLEELWKAAEFDDIFNEKDFVAVKLHFGEPGNTAFLSPQYIARVVERLKI